MDEYIECKYFIDDMPKSPLDGFIIRKLTPEESKYEVGTVIHGLKVYGVGWAIYRNIKTNEKYKIVKYFY